MSVLPAKSYDLDRPKATTVESQRPVDLLGCLCQQVNHNNKVNFEGQARPKIDMTYDGTDTNVSRQLPAACIPDSGESLHVMLTSRRW